MKRTCFLFLALILSYNAFSAGKAEDEILFTVVLDAGHGGHDVGAQGRFSKEKNINLAVTLMLGEMIEENHPDTRVVYTRKTDIFVPLHQRANIANSARANLFISIHTNAARRRNTTAFGTETYVLGADRSAQNLEVAMRENSVILYEDNHQEKYLFNPNSTESYIVFDFMQNLYMNQSISFAQAIQNQLRIHAGRKDRGVRQAGFLVLLNTAMPGVLVELGYISNPTEEQYLNSIAGKKQLAQSIYRAFVEFKNEYVRKTQTSFASESIETEQVAIEDDIVTNNRLAWLKQWVEGVNVPATTEITQSKDTIVMGVTLPPEILAAMVEPRRTIEEKIETPAIASAPAAPVTPVAPTVPTVPAVPAAPAISVTPTAPAVPAIPATPPTPTVSTAPAAPTYTNRVVYQLQILTSSVRFETDDEIFKGLSPIVRHEENGMYKYTYGESHIANEMSELRKTVQPLFPYTTVVAYDNYQGRHISLQEIIQILRENRENRTR